MTNQLFAKLQVLWGPKNGFRRSKKLDFVPCSTFWVLSRRPSAVAGPQVHWGIQLCFLIKANTRRPVDVSGKFLDVSRFTLAPPVLHSKPLKTKPLEGHKDYTLHYLWEELQAKVLVQLQVLGTTVQYWKERQVLALGWALWPGAGCWVPAFQREMAAR